LFFSPHQLRSTALQFISNFDGLVTYAVKANARADVLGTLVAAGVTTFDVASPVEMATVRAVCPQAMLHYNNPVRSVAEVAAAVEYGVASASVDDLSELNKLSALPAGTEIAVRFKLPVTGAAYDFGDKFGATVPEAVALLTAVKARGFTASLCFHPGTQCADPQAWVAYIHAAADISRQAGVSIARLNVGGGFAGHRDKMAPDLQAIFDAIHQATATAFGPGVVSLVCEPGRAMVAEAFTLAARVKSLRDDGRTLYLNDGIYGGLAEWKDMGLSPRVRVIDAAGQPRNGAMQPRVVFGPTCDSVDKLPDGMKLPTDLTSGDYLLFDGLGAYSVALSSDFNGYGLRDVVSVDRLSGQTRT
jgi:ornithine decarboxylase